MTTDPRAATFMAFADFLVPAHGDKPKFSTVCDWQAVLAALDFRTDLRENFHRGLDAGVADGAEPALEALHAGDKSAFDAITMLVITTYYMNPRVRELIGYPGQENVSYDPNATQTYLTDGTLANVIARGRRYRPTPGPS